MDMVGYLLNMQKSSEFNSQHQLKLGLVTYTSNPNTREMWVGESG